ncbi:MAG: ATP-binding protein [Clostridia bacterium]
MIEHKIIEKQLFKNMVFNLLAFTLIFAIFGTIIFNQIRISLYNNTDEELLNTKQKVLNGQIKEFNYDDIKIKIVEEFKLQGIKELINPRVIYILRNEKGNIINEDSIGRFFEDYIGYVNFNENSLDTIFNTKINGYNYRETDFKIIDEYNKTYYLQLLINTDSEEHIIKNIFKILWLSIAITVILSIIASYILSKKTLKPIIQSWNKQLEFVQNASHELRTPLTIIQAKQELLLLDPNATILDKSEDIALTLNEVKRLTKLTKDLMILARADSNEQQIKKEVTNIDELIKEISKPYIEYASMQEKEINLNLKYNKNINIDRNRIYQLMIILLDNAIKYTEKNDKIDVVTYLKDGKCVIEVKDTGIGISDIAIKHIFERFYREDKSRTRKSGGTGLGLSIADWIVSSHNGTIKATHNTPKGTIFTIKIK